MLTSYIFAHAHVNCGCVEIVTNESLTYLKSTTPNQAYSFHRVLFLFNATTQYIYINLASVACFLQINV